MSFLLGVFVFLSSAVVFASESHETFSFKKDTLSRSHAGQLQSGRLRVAKSGLSDKEFLYGIICAEGEFCIIPGRSSSSAHRVKLVEEGVFLVVRDTESAASLGRFRIVDEDFGYFYVEPASVTTLTHPSSQTSRRVAEIEILDRSLHSFQQEVEGIWFKEYLYVSLTDEESHSQETSEIHVNHYFRDARPNSDFEVRGVNQRIGYFYTNEHENIGYGSPDLDPEESKIIRWSKDADITWTAYLSHPSDESRSFIRRSVNAWLSHLPRTMSFQVEFTDNLATLAHPFKNTIYLDQVPGLTGYMGIADFVNHPATGEIFRANVFAYVPLFHERDHEPLRRLDVQGLSTRFQLNYGALKLRNKCENEQKFSATTEIDDLEDLDGLMKHEIGHTLGLRHNFRGSNFVHGNYPQGSSVMDYTYDVTEDQIGPYDDDAIRWGYLGITPASYLPFCTDDNTTSPFVVDLDPGCHRGDKVSLDPFQDLASDIVHYLRFDLPHERDANDLTGVGYSSLAILTSAILPEASPHFDQGRYDLAVSTFDLIANLDISQPESAAIQYHVFNRYVQALMFNTIGGFRARESDFQAVAGKVIQLLERIAEVHAGGKFQTKEITYENIAYALRSEALDVSFRRQFLRMLINQLQFASRRDPFLLEENSVLVARLQKVLESIDRRI